MSKSKGNVVDPMDVVNKYGPDTLRAYLLFVAQPDTPFEWSDKDTQSMHKFIEKILVMNKLKEDKNKKAYMESITQNKIEKITKYLENLQHNMALIELIDFSNKIERFPSKYAIKIFLQLLHPFTPHISEEVWNSLGEKSLIASSKWPVVDKSKINKKAEQAEEAADNTIKDIKHIISIIGKKPKKIFIYVIPPELKQYQAEEKAISEELAAEVKVFAVNDKNKHDPENKSQKAKPGRPAIYLE